MPRFEVFIPSVSADLPVDLTLRVESENWLAALKLGLEKICGARMAANILCDVKDGGSVEVTDPSTGKVFRIVELGAGPAPVRDATVPLPAVAPGAAPRAPAGARPRGTPTPTPAPAPSAAPSRAERIGRAPQVLHREAVLEEIFVRVPGLQEHEDVEEGLGYLLDIAMDKVSCESGFGLVSRGDGFPFVAGRGLKAAETIQAGIPLPAQGSIVGFCAQEVVCLAVTDVEKDPRWFRGVAERVGYPTRSMLVCPIVKEGRVFGALQLKNKKGGAFDEGDLAVLAYLAHHAAGWMERRSLEEEFERPPTPPPPERPRRTS
jgi:hypothetical protein